MTALIQIRNVPDDVHEKLKTRAAANGKSLNSLMLDIVEREVERTTLDEVLARLKARGPLGSGIQAGEAAELIRAAREERDAQLMAASEDHSGEGR